MYDIHHHLLPGLDDGPPTLAAALAQAELTVADGITHVVCTPHANHRFQFRESLLLERLDELRGALAQRHVPLTLGLGRDFHISYDNLQAAQDTPRQFTINGGPYLLVELPDHGLPPTLTQTWYDLQLLGLTVVLTHPERNPTLQQTPALLADWLRSGVLAQITAASVLGEMGRNAARLSDEWLRKRWVHVISTDAHDTERRPPRLTAAHAAVAERFGDEYADLLCSGNPQAIFNGTTLPDQQEPLELYDDEEPGRSWWRRLLGR